MRKFTLHRILLFSTMSLVILLAIVSCIKEEVISLDSSSGNLSLLPKLFDDGIDYLRGRTKTLTKAKDDTDPGIVSGDDVNAHPELHETLIETLDIFVKEKTAADNTAWLFEWHFDKDQAGALLNSSTPGGLLEKAKHLINKNWVDVRTTQNKPFDPDIEYDIYVMANNPHTHVCTHSEHQHYSGTDDPSKPANYTALKALQTHDDNTDRYYSSEGNEIGSNRVDKKAFLMDGHITWSPKPELGEQVWDVDLKRAVSKVVVNISMDDDFKDELEHEKDDQGHDLTGYWEPGAPRWRYVNFSFDVADIESGSYVQDPNNLIDAEYMYSMEGDWDSYQYLIRTYTAPFKWIDYSNTPYILMSIYYTFKGGDPVENQYIANKYGTLVRRRWYHIPICDEVSIKDVGLQRNNIYIVDASIASWGSENEEIEGEDMPLRIEYHVVPWTEKNVSSESTVVKLGAIKYLTVYPQEYILKGDETQKVELNWYASVSTDDGIFPDIDVSTLKVSYVNYQGTTVDIKGSVVKTPSSPNGTNDITITSTAPTSGANGEKVIIELTTDGLIDVSSEALDSRAIKTIEFDVKLKGSSLVRHVKIRHFPLDNIQSIAGSWSSRWSGSSSTQTVREYSFNPTRDGWSSSDGYEDNYECTLAEYNSAEPAHRSTETISGARTTTREKFLENVTTNDDRTNASSESNAVNGYWGTVARYVDYENYDIGTATISDNWDFWSHRYYQSQGGYRTYGVGTYQTYNNSWIEYKYQTYYTNVTETIYKARRYYRDVQKDVPTTGNWVDWDRDNGQTYNQANVKYNHGNTFQAKIFYNNLIYPINVTRTGNYNNYQYTYSRGTSREANGYNKYSEDNNTYATSNSSMNTLSNNHMYVIQITSTSSSYVVGRPILDANYQSTDIVVSPAFMLGSQLGANSGTTSATDAARHCGTYMEVGTDGTRYTGWRLPTGNEVGAIISYQNNPLVSGQTFIEVLGGDWYWALDGYAYATGKDNTTAGDRRQTGQSYIRCVRDLTLEDLQKLNGSN